VRVLLDEQLPVDLARELHGHQVDTVGGRGWTGVKNSDLLRRMRGDYDVLLTMDRGVEFQHNVSALPCGVVLVRAASNRMQHLRPLVPAILDTIAATKPGQLQRVGA
jgi:hypothetical protein